MLIAQGGVCAAPECLSGGPFDADHSTPQAWQEGKPDQLLCKPCHKAKTKLDVGKIAKVKRLRRGKKPNRKPIPSRGFRKDVTKRMRDGKVVPRER